MAHRLGLGLENRLARIQIARAANDSSMSLWYDMDESLGGI